MGYLEKKLDLFLIIFILTIFGISLVLLVSLFQELNSFYMLLLFLLPFLFISFFQKGFPGPRRIPGPTNIQERSWGMESSFIAKEPFSDGLGTEEIQTATSLDEIFPPKKIQEILGLSNSRIVLDPEDLEIIHECENILRKPLSYKSGADFPLKGQEKLYFTCECKLLKKNPLEGAKIFFPLESPLFAFKGLHVPLKKPEILMEGKIGVTSSRFVFSGAGKVFELEYTTISNFELYSNALKIRSPVKYQTETILCSNPPLLVLLANQVYQEMQ